MAKRKTSKKSNGLSEWVNLIISVVMKPQVIGLALILVSALTILSLITNSRGVITSRWIDGLEYLFGIGAWGVPFALGALGFWIVIAAVERMDNISVQRPIGFALLLLVISLVASLAIARPVRILTISQGDGGGLIGALLADLLQDVIGLWGAWAVATMLGMAGLFLLLDELLATVADDLWFWFKNWWEIERVQERSTSSVPRLQKIRPEIPLPSGKIPLWKKARELFTSPSTQPEPLFRPAKNPIHQESMASSRTQRTANSASEQQAKRKSKQKPADQEQVPADFAAANQPDELDPAIPRIIGDEEQEQKFELPQLGDVLNDWERVTDNDDHIRDQGAQIQETLALFGVPVSFEGVNQGPTVTQYLIRPGYDERTIKGEVKRTKVKVSKIANLANDLALALAAATVRIEAPVPGTSYVGIEVPNQSSNIVGLRELMESKRFDDILEKGKLAIALGEDVKGNAIVSDLAKMPHMLIAGATGAGKSVCINSIIISLLCTNTPDTLRLLMIDPKMVELSVYNKIPHLLSPVVTETDKAAGVLYWAVKEMERRYQLCSKANCRDLERYNAYLEKQGEKPLPYIVVIVDEMADLMMAAPEEVEKHICRLAQMARAIGIHMIIATQRPSVDVITGLIKANFPSRIAFAVSSQTDSRVILDSPGADRLLGKGDMLFMSPEGGKLQRLQGTFLNDDEINNVVDYWKKLNIVPARKQPLAGPQMDLFDEEVSENFAADTISGNAASEIVDLSPQQLTPQQLSSQSSPLAPKARPRPNKKSAPAPPRPPATTPGTSKINLSPVQNEAGEVLGQQSYGAPKEQASIFDEIKEMRALDDRDELFEDAVRVIQETDRGSVSLLQKKLRIGYNRSGRIIEQLVEAGYLGPDRGGSNGRQVLIGAFNSDQGASDQVVDDQSVNNQIMDNNEFEQHGLGQNSELPAPRIIGGVEDDDESQGPPRVWM